jgi:hypothetical protein
MFIQELNRFRKSDKFEALSDNSKSKLMLCMERHLQEVTDMMHPQTAEEGADINPNMKESTGAQEMEAELQSQPDVMGEVPQEMPQEQLPIPEEGQV